MTIPNSSEVEETLSLIAAEIARVNSQVKQINEKNQPLNDEKNSLENKIKEFEEWLSNEIRYSHDQEAEAYKAYQQIKAMWDKFREDSRKLKAEREGNAAERIREINNALWDDKLELRKLNEELASLQRRWDQALRIKKDAENYASVEERLDKATMGAPWREWAKDHQIVGGKRIAYRGRILLGDTMGLGKTLTSIIACDLIRAMTSDADEEHPVVIETN